MANNITGASLNGIYERLNDAPEYHPLEADTFMDWSVEAGDIITVKRGDTEYSSPVQSTRMVWKGTPETTITSVGEKERESISRTSKKKYGRGSGALRNELYIYKEFTSSDGMLHSAIYMSESRLTVQFDNAISDVHSSILQTAVEIRSEVHASSSSLYSYIDETATYIETVVEDINNNLGSAILQTASQIRSEVHAANSTLYSYIDQTATYIESVVSDVNNNLGSAILQTASQIRSEVHAANSTVYSYISQTATSITSRVEDVNSDLHSEILQTQSMIRSAVWTANSMVYSYIDQTASYILDHVGERTGAKVFTGMEEPVDSPENPITPGDLWLDGNYINFWDDADFKFVSYDPEEPEYDWTQLKGSKLKVWKDGAWQLAEDNTTLAEDTDIRRTKDQINLIAHNLVTVDGEMRSNLARLDIKADQIVSTVNERIADVGSRITQTAYEIRSEVHSANSRLYSAIEQTATSIRAYVIDEINDVGSEILQTANQIRAEVHAANSTLYSYVDQTATYIRQEVASVESGVRSSITTEANRISLVVEGTGANAKIKPAAIVSSINDGASSIIISANHINLDGYVKATDITTDLLTTKIATATNVNVKRLTLTNNGYISLPTNDGSVNVTGANATDTIKNLKVVATGNNYKIQAVTWGNAEWHDIPNTTFSRATSLSGTWSSNTYTVTASPQGNTDSVSPYVQPVSSQGGAYVDLYVATPKSSNPYYDTHGDAKKLYLVSSSGTIYLKDQNSTTQGSVYAQIAGGGSSTVTDISFWDANNNRWTGTHDITVGVTLTAYALVDGSWQKGDEVRINPKDTKTDKGSGWYCTVENLSSGGKRCRLTQEFSAGSSVPFTNGNSYHLYT